VRQDVASVIIFACATDTPTTRRESFQQAADYVK